MRRSHCIGGYCGPLCHSMSIYEHLVPATAPSSCTDSKTTLHKQCGCKQACSGHVAQSTEHTQTEQNFFSEALSRRCLLGYLEPGPTNSGNLLCNAIPGQLIPRQYQCRTRQVRAGGSFHVAEVTEGVGAKSVIHPDQGCPPPQPPHRPPRKKKKILSDNFTAVTSLLR